MFLSQTSNSSVCSVSVTLERKYRVEPTRSEPNCLYSGLFGNCELIGRSSGMWEPQGLWMMSVWLTQSWQCPRCGRGSRTLALCPWWTSWLQLAGSLGGFHRKSLAGGERWVSTRTRAIYLCRRVKTHPSFYLFWCIYYHMKTRFWFGWQRAMSLLMWIRAREDSFRIHIHKNMNLYYNKTGSKQPVVPMVWMMAFWTILSSLSFPRPEETLVLEFLLELSPSSKSTLILRCLSRVLNTSSTVGPASKRANTHTHTHRMKNWAENWESFSQQLVLLCAWAGTTGELPTLFLCDNMTKSATTVKLSSAAVADKNSFFNLKAHFRNVLVSFKLVTSGFPLISTEVALRFKKIRYLHSVWQHNI